MAQDPNKGQIGVKNIPPKLLEKAKQIAKEQDRSLNQVVREMLREFVAEHEQKLKPQK